jgi:hypothetical protein
MDTSKEQIKKVIKLDVIAAFFKLMSIAFILIIIINAIIQTPLWYITILIDIIFISIYKCRANFISKQFKSYKVVYATIVKMNIISFIQGTRRLTYSYEYESQKYDTSSSIADFLRDSYSVKKGNLIKVIIDTNNPQTSKILELY